MEEESDPAKPLSIWGKIQRTVVIAAMTLLFGAGFGIVLFGTINFGKIDATELSFWPFWGAGTIVVLTIVLIERSISKVEQRIKQD